MAERLPVFADDLHLLPALLLAKAKAEAAGIDVQVQRIGLSRAGRPLFAFHAGSGPRKFSITAGAHADEPAGPMAALQLCELLAGSDPEGERLRSQATWCVFPQVNPDGSAANSPWFAPDPDLVAYLKFARREGPGEDIEFSYPNKALGYEAGRPENKIVSEHLQKFGPVDLHASLHGMAFASGAWFLIGKDHVTRTKQLREQLRAAVGTSSIGLHDIERHGEKGFNRIGPGFCTTPTAEGMREFFNRQNDPDKARLMTASSMDFVRELGGNPLVMVSEIPLFHIVGGVSTEAPEEHPAPDDPPYNRLRSVLPKWRDWALEGKDELVREAALEYQVKPVSWDVQCGLIHTMIKSMADWSET